MRAFDFATSDFHEFVMLTAQLEKLRKASGGQKALSVSLIWNACCSVTFSMTR
jgi:hypothetical protein